MSKKDIKYKKEYADQVEDMFANGEDVVEVAVRFGVSRQTFYNWVKKHKKFAAGYERGKMKSEAWWCKLGRAGAAGKMPVQAPIWIFNMKNKFNWADKKEIKVEGKDLTPILNVTLSKE